MPCLSNAVGLSPGAAGAGFVAALAFSVNYLDEPPFFGGIEILLQRSEELLAFLRCDVPLPADLYPDGRSVSLTQRHTTTRSFAF